MNRIDPENPATVPEKYRERMYATAWRIGGETASTLQMLTDLLALAVNDGCVAAGWAFEQITGEIPKPDLFSNDPTLE